MMKSSLVLAACLWASAEGFASPGPGLRRSTELQAALRFPGVVSKWLTRPEKQVGQEQRRGRFLLKGLPRLPRQEEEPSKVLERFDGPKGSRSLRETLYDEPKWQHRMSLTRYFRTTLSSLRLGVVRGLAVDLAMVLATALVVAGLDLLGFLKLRMSPLPLSLTSPVLALLLACRTNAAYARWWEARSIWGGLINRVRDLNRQGTAMNWEKGGYKFAALAVAFSYTLKVHLRDMACGKEATAAEHEELRADLTALLGRADADAILAQDHRPHAVTKAMTSVLGGANLEPSIQARVDEGISELLDYVGLCERIVKTPIPVLYTRLTACSLCAWLLFLPSALLGIGFGFWHTVFGSAITASVLLAIDEIGVQIEEPFSTLPLAAICDGLRSEYDRAIQNTVYSPPATVPTTTYPMFA